MTTQNSNIQIDPLFELIKSLTKSEKRQFSLYVKRLDGNEDAKFYALFKILDKQKFYNEEEILKSTIVTKQQISNLKGHLYKQILICLRLNPSQKTIKTQIREQIDNATILYHKGLYKQSLKILEKAKNIAITYEEKYLAFEMIELEKIIETQYITRSISNRADQLSREAKTLSKQNNITSKLSNLSLQLYSHFLQNGYVKNSEELEQITTFFYGKLPKYKIEALGLRERMWLYKSYLWFSLLTQNFIQSYKYAKKWVQLFNTDNKLIQLHPVFYLKGMNYLLEACFFMNKKAVFAATLKDLENVIETKKIPSNPNCDITAFQYLYTNKLHSHFLHGSFKEGEYLVPIIKNYIEKFESRLDNHYIIHFYYKIACLYFGMESYKRSIEYLNAIINSKNFNSAEDLQCFARILNLIAHYELGLDENLEKQFKRTYKFLLKMENLQEVQKVFLNSIRDLGDVYPQNIKNEFQKIHKKLKKYENHPYEKRAFLYLDILSWLESKIKNKSIAEIIKKKSTKKNI